MTGEAAVPERSDGAAPWARLLERHRGEWVAELLRDRPIVDLAAVDDPVRALADAPEGAAFVWLDGYLDADGRDGLRTAIEAAGRRDVPIVIGLEADSEGEGQREAEALLGLLGDARAVTQELAAGSLIGATDGDDEAAARRRSVHVLVCANVDTGESSSDVHAEAAPLMTGYVAWLEQANRELRKANTRLGRERLGKHDAAAAAVEDRRLDLERRIAELEGELAEQRRLAVAHHDMLVEAQQDKERTLQAPRYRLVDSLRELAFNLPGVSHAIRRRSRQVSQRWDEQQPPGQRKPGDE